MKQYRSIRLGGYDIMKQYRIISKYPNIKYPSIKYQISKYQISMSNLFTRFYTRLRHFYTLLHMFIHVYISGP